MENSQNAAQHNAMRAAFEHHYSNEGTDPWAIKRSGEGYSGMQAQIAWELWQAAWKAATPAPALMPACGDPDCNTCDKVVPK